LVLQQNHIVSGQVDGTAEDPYIKEYEHNHMLRAGFNGNYGTRLTPNGMVTAQNKYTTTFKLSYANPFPFSSFQTKIKDCIVVAYLIDMETKEVIQVEEMELN
jgi:hypothetical protein